MGEGETHACGEGPTVTRATESAYLPGGKILWTRYAPSWRSPIQRLRWIWTYRAWRRHRQVYVIESVEPGDPIELG